MLCAVTQRSHSHSEQNEDPHVLVTARIRRMGEGNVLTRICPSIHDSVCPQGGGSGPAGRGGQVKGQSSPGGQVQPVGGVRSSCPGWVGVRSKVNPAGGGGGQVKGQSSWGGIRSKVNPAGGGQVQLVGGSGPAGWGGVRSSRGGQHLAPSCGWYASCIHAGGLSCLECYD